jgi:hypothetical protein
MCSSYVAHYCSRRMTGIACLVVSLSLLFTYVRDAHASWAVIMNNAANDVNTLCDPTIISTGTTTAMCCCCAVVRPIHLTTAHFVAVLSILKLNHRAALSLGVAFTRQAHTRFAFSFRFSYRIVRICRQLVNNSCGSNDRPLAVISLCLFFSSLLKGSLVFGYGDANEHWLKSTNNFFGL